MENLDERLIEPCLYSSNMHTLIDPAVQVFHRSGVTTEQWGQILLLCKLSVQECNHIFVLVPPKKIFCGLK